MIERSISAVERLGHWIDREVGENGLQEICVTFGSDVFPGIIGPVHPAERTQQIENGAKIILAMLEYQPN